MLELRILLRLQKLLYLSKRLCLPCQIVKLPVRKDTESLLIIFLQRFQEYAVNLDAADKESSAAEYG